MKTIMRLSAEAFFERRPDRALPARDSLLFARQGAPGWLLRRKAEAVQQASTACLAVCRAEFASDGQVYAPQGPGIVGKTSGLCAIEQPMA